MNSNRKKALLKDALDAGDGIVRLAPAWVPRSFLVPGGRLKLAPRDLYALGADRGGIDERWLASTVRADNGPGTPEDEGLSYVVMQDGAEVVKILLKEAIELLGDQILGEAVMRKYEGWMVLAKFFDNAGPIPHHLHPDDEHAKKVGRVGKPEAYYFPSQLNFVEQNFPYTFFGLEPGTTKEDVIRCLERWNEGDNGILDHSKAYRLRPGTGWNIPPGILHAPGTLVTYEPQKASDVASLFQSMVDGRAMTWDSLVKDVPEDRHHDLDYIVSMLDWERNVDPEFMRHYCVTPKPVKSSEAMKDEGYHETWVAYSSEEFSAKELTVFPGKSVGIRDRAAYGLIVVQGRGAIGNMDVASPTMIRFGELTEDECFVSVDAAAEGVTVTNTSAHENLVMLKHFGPGNPDLPDCAA
ncbi:MAG: hypothetical protein KAR36_03545 [Candidatus Latescibacteria bacterium]|nr:hypothetical protein [Candidatus Latescibacterota bacterium]